MTKSTEPNVTITEPPTASKRIIKIGTCLTLSNNSTLQYHIGCGDDRTIYFQIKANTGGGFFNDEWLALTDIQQCFENWPVDNPITSFALNSLFTGKSANSPAFLMAILKEERIVVTLKGKSRSHEYQGSEEFVVEMDKLIADGVDLKSDNKKFSSTPKTTAKRTKKSA